MQEHWENVNGRALNLSKVLKLTRLTDQNTIRFHFPHGVPDSDFNYTSEEAADKALEYWRNRLTKKNGGHMFEGLGQDVREFLKSNRDMIWTVIFVLIVDQVAFEGAFRERVKGLLENLLNKAEGKAALPAAPAATK